MLDLTKDDYTQLILAVSEHDRRIEKLETIGHTCLQTNKICDIEQTQKALKDAIEKMQKTQEVMHADIIAYKLEAGKHTRTVIIGFIGMIVSILVMSLTLYTKVMDTLDSKFLKVYEITTKLQIESGKK
jgi:anaerobic ribonucleoside-triphosphate reductase